MVSKKVINYFFFKLVSFQKQFHKTLKTIFCSLNFLFSLTLILKTILKEQYQTPIFVAEEQFFVFKNKNLFFSYNAKQVPNF